MTEQSEKPNEINEVVKPADRITVVVNGENKEVFMSGGLIRELSPIVGGLEDFAGAFVDTEVQKVLLIEVLKPRNPRGNPSENKEYGLDDFSMSLEECDKLLNWVMDHVLHFFVNSLTSAKSLAERNQKTIQMIEELTRLQTGSQNSQEKNPPAGPSTAAQAT